MEPNLTKVIVSQVDAPPICVFQRIHLLQLTSSHLPGSGAPKGNEKVLPRSIFRCENFSFREDIFPFGTCFCNAWDLGSDHPIGPWMVGFEWKVLQLLSWVVDFSLDPG